MHKSVYNVRNKFLYNIINSIPMIENSDTIRIFDCSSIN